MYDRFWAYCLGLFYGLLIGIFLTLAFQSITQINCPQEDSCHADYYNGAWHIEVNEQEVK